MFLSMNDFHAILGGSKISTIYKVIFMLLVLVFFALKAMGVFS